MTNERLLKLLKAKAEATKAVADEHAKMNGFECASEIPADGPTFATNMFSEWCCILCIVRMIEDDDFAEDLFKIYLPEDETK